MHLQFYLRGLPQHVELWKALTQGQFFKWRRILKETNEEEIILVQGGLRDSVLGTYEYIFPKEALATVLAIFGKVDPKDIGAELTIGRGMKLGVLRKLTGTKKIPKRIWEKAKDIPKSIVINDAERGLSYPGGAAKVSVHIIGIKEDVTGDMLQADGKTYIQEML